MKKSTILFGISIVNMVLFLIGMIILFAAAASGSADGNNFALILSIISGVIFEIITIVQIVKEKKSAKEDSSFFPYCVACFKKKNGKPMFQLVVAAILNVLPLALFIVLLIAIVLFTSSDSKTANNISKGIDLIADNSQTSGKSKPKKNTASQSKKSGESGKCKDLSNQELNTIASHSGNDMKTITPGDDKKIKKIYQDNPGISDEDAFEIFKKTNPNATLETVRAHKPTLNNTNDELNVIARSGNNNIKTTTPGDDKKIKKIYQDNPGISDEDAFGIFKKSRPAKCRAAVSLFPQLTIPGKHGTIDCIIWYNKLYYKATPHKARLAALHAICLLIFRHITQKSLAIRQYGCGISMQSAEKSGCASYAQALCGVA